MKTIFIPAIRKNLSFNKKVLDKLKSKKFDILYTIQYENLAKEVRKYLKSKNKIKQVLGCSIIKSKNNILLITDGKFHALNIAVNSKKEIYIFNGNKIEKITKLDIEKYNNIKKGKILRFLSSNEVGIIVSTKLYQNKLKEALILKEKIEKMNKRAYVFICDNINIDELENFSLPIYINTACPGLDKDSNRVLNYIDILPYIKQ
jgi:diphthamide biosynthesis enzyme Dph1/Dph2-like protein